MQSLQLAATVTTMPSDAEAHSVSALSYTMAFEFHIKADLLEFDIAHLQLRKHRLKHL